MRTIINKLLICFVALLFVACNEDKMFEKELYKNVVFALSDENQVLSVEHDLNLEESVGYLSIGYGGTNSIKKDIFVEIESDRDLLYEYNRLQYDTATLRFAKELDIVKYQIPEMSTTLKVGATNAYSLIEIKVKPQGLSPDSIYMIPLRIKSVSEGNEVNIEKDNVLYRVLIKNDYAQQKVTTYYKMKGTREYINNQDIAVKEPTTSDKIVSPISKNGIRMLAGNMAFKDKNGASLEEIDSFGILVKVNDDNTLTLKPMGSLQIEMVGNSEDNRYEYDEELKYQAFYFSYKFYGAMKKTDGSGGEYMTWITMTERCIRY